MLWSRFKVTLLVHCKWVININVVHAVVVTYSRINMYVSRNKRVINRLQVMCTSGHWSGMIMLCARVCVLRGVKYCVG